MHCKKSVYSKWNLLLWQTVCDWIDQFGFERFQIFVKKMVFNIICDYLIFFGFLVGSTLFPLWGSLIRKKKPTDQSETKANYVFASGQVGIFAMMLSIARGTLGVRAFLGEFLFILNWFLCCLFLLDLSFGIRTLNYSNTTHYIFFNKWRLQFQTIHFCKIT